MPGRGESIPKFLHEKNAQKTEEKKSFAQEVDDLVKKFANNPEGFKKEFDLRRQLYFESSVASDNAHHKARKAETVTELLALLDDDRNRDRNKLKVVEEATRLLTEEKLKSRAEK